MSGHQIPNISPISCAFVLARVGLSADHAIMGGVERHFGPTLRPDMWLIGQRWRPRFSNGFKRAVAEYRIGVHLRKTCRNMLTCRKYPTYARLVVEVDAFSALANPTRRRLLELLIESPHTAGHLAEQFDLSRPAISEHLSVLRNAHLVRDRVEGRERIYEIDAGPLADVDDWLRPFERYWRKQLSSLSDYLDKEHEQ